MTMLYRDEAVVLRTQKLGEADRIITLLTRQHGRVRAVAKGVRKTTSRFGARVEPFMVVDIQLYEGRSLDTVTQVDVIGAYGLQIASDYPRYTAATAMLETAERMTEVEREPAVQQYILLAGGLRSLAAGEHQAALILDAYLLRALAVAGWAPSFVDCARCGEPGPHRAFAVGAGGAVCRSCRPPGAAAPHPDTFALLAALMTGEWPVADASEERRRREASGLVAAYLQWHLERRVRSLRWVERGTGPGVPAAADGRDGAGEGSAVGHDSVVDLTQPPRGDAEFAGWANAHADAAHPDATYPDAAYPDAAYPAYPDDAHPDAAYPGVVDDLGAR